MKIKLACLRGTFVPSKTQVHRFVKPEVRKNMGPAAQLFWNLNFWFKVLHMESLQAFYQAIIICWAVFPKVKQIRSEMLFTATIVLLSL